MMIAFTVMQLNQLPAGAPDITFSLTTPFSSTSFALSLLLVFRTNTSYFRWNEARTIWGGITNRSRDIVRQVELPAFTSFPDLLINKTLIACYPPTTAVLTERHNQ